VLLILDAVPRIDGAFHHFEHNCLVIRRKLQGRVVVGFRKHVTTNIFYYDTFLSIKYGGYRLTIHDITRVGTLLVLYFISPVLKPMRSLGSFFFKIPILLA